MKRLTLKEPATITGPSPLGAISGEQGIEMRPLSMSEARKTRANNGMGWYWETSDGTLVPIDMSLVREAEEIRTVESPEFKLHPRHFLYFQRGKEQLNCVEHILALKTLGLDGVVIKALKGSTWVPYDGRAKMYWDAIQDHVKYDGELKPMTMQLAHTYEDVDKRHGWKRSVTLDNRDGKDELVVQVTIDYQIFGGKKTIEHRFPVDDPSAMADILSSRTLFRPWLQPALPLIKALGWPHAENVLKPSEFDKKNSDPFLREIALHRMLDFLGAAALLAEAGTCVSGRLEADKGNHATDLLFLKQLKAVAKQMYPDADFLNNSHVYR